MKKELRRSRSNKRVAGVCGGLGNYFDIDPVVFRIIFGIALVCCGTGILAYFVLCLLMPKE